MAQSWAMPSRGFSLVELMTTIAIAAILLAVGLPNFHSLIQNQRMTATVNDFFAAINLTRSEALQRGGRADLVPARDNDWSTGWMVFVDRNNDQKLSEGEKVIFSHGPVADGLTIKGSLTDSKVQYLTYNGTGRTRTRDSDAAANYGAFTLTLDRQVRKININALGRPRVCNPRLDTEC